MIRNLSLIAVFLLCASLAMSAPVRIKDLVEYEGVRANDLIGYGLVIGLDGTGDSLRNAPFTEDLISNILERLGTNVTGEAFRTKNIASVFVTAKLPPFSRGGSYIDVAVATIGDASNLRGGILVMTPLRAADGDIYAVAQGAIIAGGAAVRGAAEQIIEGVPTAGVIPSGALVEREVVFDFKILKTINLALRQADFSTAHKIETLINKNFKSPVARMLDAATIEIDILKTNASSPAHALSAIENLTLIPERKARVVVDQRSGTIVMGAEVRISRVAVSQGNLTLHIQEAPQAVQPNPFSQGETIVLPRSDVSMRAQENIALAEVPDGANLSEIIAGLNALGVGAKEMIDILKSIKAAGALHAEFIVQ
jgi:flagellar P-ring protein precursor FlgI